MIKFMLKFICRSIIWVFLLGIIAPPFTIGILSSLTKSHPIEKRWLNNAIIQLQIVRLTCNDLEKQEALNYTIKRYNKIGPWNVNIIKFPWPFDKAIGMNCPWCPGLTLDPEIMGLPIEQGATILLHEAIHDYYPYFHPYINAKMKRIGCL